MTEISGINPNIPHQARVWDYLGGGKNNYDADRVAAGYILQGYPQMGAIVRQARAFQGRVVRFLVEEAGIRQFLDIGTGLPTDDHVHGVAQRSDPTCRIVYVDNDPLVLVHAQALLTSSPEGECAYLEADARDPETVLRGAAETLDFDEPIALMMFGVLGTVPDDDDARALVRRFVDALPSGSYLVFEDGTNVVIPDAAKQVEQVVEEGRAYDYRLRTPEQIARFFDGLKVLDPGVVSVSRWRPEPSSWGEPEEVDAFGGVGLKP
ncbi:SAM-dependent methyltransferase [Streptosporangium sp. NPDC050855]|uniref:SAM-dependent methyltransferase n=1 Tax=Streptosporangium sp. NPDC050855 TaxID=3366194 RepID=UPI0037BB49E1